MKENIIKIGKTIAISGIIAIAFIVLTFVWLSFFTNHDEEFSVPDFRGLTLSEVAKLAEEKDLRFEISDSVYNAPGKRGSVMEQIPPKDFMVKEDRKIFLTIKSVNPELIQMPSLMNVSLPQAKADIETYGLKIGKLIYQPSKYENIVLDQQIGGVSIVQGEMIAKGTRINLVLGKKKGMDKTLVPNLEGLNRTDAEFMAADFMMNVGEVNYDETVISYEDSIDAKVRKQSPLKNVKMKPGDEVKIWLSMISEADADSTATPADTTKVID